MALKAMEAAKVAAPTKKATVNTAKAEATAKNQQCYSATAISNVAVAVTAARAATPAKAILARNHCGIQKACQDRVSRFIMQVAPLNSGAVLRT